MNIKFMLVRVKFMFMDVISCGCCLWLLKQVTSIK